MHAIMTPLRPQLIVSADDFGLSPAVNEAVERAHRDGILTTTSLMVAGDAADDAIARARRLPGLHVGLHLVAVEGPAVDPASLGDLVGPDGCFGSDQLRLALRYRFSRTARARLRHEVAAQFRAFAATGLPLDHANAHKHMHLHPTVGRVLIEEGRAHALRAIRIPAEPPAIMSACGTPPGPGARALHGWTRLLRAQSRRAGLQTTDHCFGIAWSGHMTEARLLTLARHLPPGVSEIYTHPAAARDPVLDRLMPGYQHQNELTALLSPEIHRAFAAAADATAYPYIRDRC